MTSRDSASSEITPAVLLRAYACGIFPMAESADDPTLFWVEPELRGVIPLDGFRVASRLARTVRSDAFRVTVNTAFKAVIAGCAAPQPGREDTWINRRIRDLYSGLYELGHCHSVEAWQSDELVGGLYGVSLGRAFFGESMFHTRAGCLQSGAGASGGAAPPGGFQLLDTQYVTEHLKSFGALGDFTSALHRPARQGAHRRARRFPQAADDHRSRAHGRWRSSPRGNRTRLHFARTKEGRTPKIPNRPGPAPAAVVAAGPPAAAAVAAGLRRAPLQGRLGRGASLRRGGGVAAGLDAGSGAAPNRLLRLFAVGQPDVVDRMLDAMQAGARGEHPAREDPLHLALQA